MSSDEEEEILSHAKVKFIKDKFRTIVEMEDIEEFRLQRPKTEIDFEKNKIYTCWYSFEKDAPKKYGVQIGCLGSLENLESRRPIFRPLDNSLIEEYEKKTMNNKVPDETEKKDKENDLKIKEKSAKIAKEQKLKMLEVKVNRLMKMKLNLDEESESSDSNKDLFKDTEEIEKSFEKCIDSNADLFKETEEIEEKKFNEESPEKCNDFSDDMHEIEDEENVNDVLNEKDDNKSENEGIINENDLKKVDKKQSEKEDETERLKDTIRNLKNRLENLEEKHHAQLSGMKEKLNFTMQENEKLKTMNLKLQEYFIMQPSTSKNIFNDSSTPKSSRKCSKLSQKLFDSEDDEPVLEESLIHPSNNLKRKKESDDSEIVKKKRTSVNSLMPNEGTRNFGDVFTDPTTNSKMVYLRHDLSITKDKWKFIKKQSSGSKFCKQLLRYFYTREEMKSRCVSEKIETRTPEGVHKRRMISPKKTDAIRKAYQWYVKNNNPKISQEKLDQETSKSRVNHFFSEDINAVNKYVKYNKL